MPDLERSQELLHHQLAQILNQEIMLEGVLLTVGYVDLDPALKYAKVGVSVLPEKFYGTALDKLRNAKGQIRKRLATKLKWRTIPKLIWEIDSREKKAAELEEIFKQIEQ